MKIVEGGVDVFPAGMGHIMLIQEAGTQIAYDRLIGKVIGIEFGRKIFDGFFVPPLDVKNMRCTTGILIDRDVCSQWGAYQFDYVYDENIARPIVCCDFKIDGEILRIATIHATARENIAVEEIKKVCYMLNAWQENLALKSKWILMGDLNQCTDSLDGYISDYNVNRISMDTPTHQGGRALDHALFSENYPIEDVQLCTPDHFMGSDHIPVYIEI